MYRFGSGIKNQYDRINAMKLDKSVFEATMMQPTRYRMTCTKSVPISVNFSNVRERTSKNIMERPVMKKNAYVTIIASPELSEMRLDELVGRRGLVVEDLPQNRKKNRGGLVLLEEIYMDEFLWFIPEESVSYE